MSTLTRKEVEAIAHLARLAITEAELPTYVGSLSSILALIEQLNVADTRDVEPMAHPLAGQTQPSAILHLPGSAGPPQARNIFPSASNSRTDGARLGAMSLRETGLMEGTHAEGWAAGFAAYSFAPDISPRRRSLGQIRDKGL